MSEKEADKLLDEILELFEEADIKINTKLTLFAKVQNAIYKCVKGMFNSVTNNKKKGR